MLFLDFFFDFGLGSLFYYDSLWRVCSKSDEF